MNLDYVEAKWRVELGREEFRPNGGVGVRDAKILIADGKVGNCI